MTRHAVSCCPYQPSLIRTLGLALSCLALAACAHAPSPRLVGTYWKLDSVAGQAVQLKSDTRQPFLLLLSDGQRLRGYASCNALAGQFNQPEGRQSLRLNVQQASHMHCPQAMALEKAYLHALQHTRREVIDQQQLTLLNAQGQPLARLTALGRS